MKTLSLGCSSSAHFLSKSLRRQVNWLLRYCNDRYDFLMNPLQHTNEVHMFIDETFLYRDEAGNYSWYLQCEPDFNCWAKGVGSLPHTRWGIVQALFTW